MKNRFWVKIVVPLLSFGLCSGTVLASETEVQTERVQEEAGLLNEFLGTAALKEAIREKGTESSLLVSLMEETAEMLAFGGWYEVLEDLDVNLGIAWEPTEAYWNLHVGGVAYGDCWVNANLHGNREKLMLSCAPLYDGVLGIEDGCVSEWYAGSGLEDLVVNWLEGPSCSEVPGLELEFYPEKSQAEEVGVLGRQKKRFGNKIDEFRSHITMETEILDGKEICHMTAYTRDILEIGEMALSQSLALAVDSGMLDYYDAMDIVYDFVYYYIEETEEKFDDVIRIDVVKEQGQLTELCVSTTVMDRRYHYDEAEEEYVWEMEEVEISCMADVQNTRTDSTDIAIVSLQFREGKETVWTIDPLVVSFDAGTGCLDVTGLLSDPFGDVLTITVDSVFADVVKGESFVWKIDELSLASGGEEIGLTGMLCVNAGIQEFVRPESTLMINEASGGELFSVISDVMMNARRLVNDVEKRIWPGLG